MVERKLKTLMTVLLLAAGLAAGRPCDAADLSSTTDGKLTRLGQMTKKIETKLESVKKRLSDEFATLKSLEARIRAGGNLDTVPGELLAAMSRTEAMADDLSALAGTAITVGEQLTRILDAARARRDHQLAKAAERELARLALVKDDILVTSQGVEAARATVRRLWGMLGA